MRTKKDVLKTSVGIKHYQNLIIARKKRLAVLENDERERYHKFVDNPSGSNLDEPHSMKDVPYHSNAVRSFLSHYPDIMQTDPTHNLYIMGKHVSDDPRQEGRLIHYLTHDYADIHNAPHGAREFIDALLKRGFRIEDIGNKYIREHLIQKRNGAVPRSSSSTMKQEHVSPPVFSPHPPTSPKPVHRRSRLPVTTTPKHHSASETPHTSRQILRHLQEYRKKQQTPTSGFAPGVRPRGRKQQQLQEEGTTPRRPTRKRQQQQKTDDQSPTPSHRTRSKKQRKSSRR